ncbi:hypothetical protein [Adhaeribacter aquaticus]|uniref:hypothetical protein n=1 Tax=Adhaeribacter aquaticus TaxID=299567 RepID=UPI0004257E93|nr:hypothetical protein [Adhaeribacter aquaticus]
MATAFLFIQLAESASFMYQQPLLNWVKAHWPQTDIIDIDSQSDDSLVSYVVRLAKESEQLVVYFRTSFPNMALGKAFRVVEEIIGERKPNLILLEGTHRQLSGIFGAREYLNFVQATTEEPLKAELEKFLNLSI